MLIQELAEWQSDQSLEGEQLAYQLANIIEELEALKRTRAGTRMLRRNAASIERSAAKLLALTLQAEAA